MQLEEFTQEFVKLTAGVPLNYIRNKYDIDNSLKINTANELGVAVYERTRDWFPRETPKEVLILVETQVKRYFRDQENTRNYNNFNNFMAALHQAVNDGWRPILSKDGQTKELDFDFKS